MSTPIAELFERDPMKLSEQDLKEIIQYLREARGRFALGDAKAGTPTSKKRPAAKPAVDASAIGVDDLLKGLDL